MDKFNINNLTLEEKIGQLIVFGFDALTLNDHAIELIKDFKAGNVILFARNVKTPEQLFLLNKSLQKLALKEIGIPLFITIDQEGGMVTRIQNGATFFPGAMTIAATNDPHNAYLTGLAMGEELKNLFVNINLAPSLDINNNPKNPVIGVRSYADDKEKVALFGLEFIKGLQKNVIATAKHFPGHGDTKVDSHKALPRVNFSLERIMDIETYPFKKAIDHGIKAIMSSHIIYDAIDPTTPVTLSKKVLTDFLRKELHFKGLIITDGMGMNAIKDNYGTVNGSLLALKAGADLFCICHSYEWQKEVLLLIKEEVLNGSLNIELINDRVSRILSFKKDLDINLNTEYQDIKEKVISHSHQELARTIVENAVTQVIGKIPQVDLQTILISISPSLTSGADETINKDLLVEEVKKELKDLKTMTVSYLPSAAEINSVLKNIQNYQKVIVTTYNSSIYFEQSKLVSELLNSQKEIYVASMRNPYDLTVNSGIKNYVCFYEYTSNSIKAFVKYLKGQLVPMGSLPIKL